MRRATFEVIRALVRDQSAIVLEDDKEYLVQSRLAPVLRSQGIADLDALGERLDKRDPELAELVVDAMTTNETSFFRDQKPFEVLCHQVLPDVIADNADRRTLDIWSAACSTGQEPYSVAMLVADHFPELAEWEVRIFASDLSRSVLDRAKRGEYRQVEVNRGLAAPQLMRHFTRRGIKWKLNDRIRARVEFERLNLMDRWPVMPRFDVVMLRNVLIYFDVVDKDRVLSRIAEQVRPGGYLFLGGSESPPTAIDHWERVEVPRSGCYRRR
ncbi:MAG: protein-glutamate O-methyltransferase CheR [Myxococcota bacterium]